MRKLFYARHFQPTPWDIAEEKAEFANRFVRFVESDFNRQFFTGKFYQRMVCMFGFHAFPNSQNFWEHYFGNEAGKRRFVLTCIEHRHAGDPATTFADAHARLQDWLHERFPTLTTDDQSHATSVVPTDGTDANVFEASLSVANKPSSEDANTDRKARVGPQRSFMW